ncbi:MAG: hypothetical protein QNJ22_14855 [Desulfosarcinaceae bacterium]|nr:hypothetical protein [Desulfosarcinaceae bacterium]
MYAKDSMSPFVTFQDRLECRYVWGGIKNQDFDISAGRIMGSIYSASSEGAKGGDIYYLGACRGDEISRLAIADVTGHGEAVAEISQFVYEALNAHM